VFTAPVILPMLAELFARHNALDRLQAFVSDNACRIYNLVPPTKTIVLTEAPWQVPARYGDLVPFAAGATLPWRILDS
jgi:dihydroorotase